MALEVGIVGLPASGKSALFHALTGSRPTGDVGMAAIPDERLGRVAEVVRARKVTPAAIRIVEVRGTGPELLGNLRQRQAEVVMEDEDRALLRGDAPEGAFELVALDDRHERVRRCGAVHREDANVGRPAAAAPGLPVAGVDEQAMEPGVELLDVPQRRQLAPGEHQRLLDGVLGKTEIAQDPKRDREESVAGPTCQAGERFLITGSRPFDEG